MVIELTTDDKRLGTFDKDGGIVAPLLSIDGKPYFMNECSRYYFTHEGTRYFVVVHVSHTEPLEVAIVNPALKPLKPAAKAMKVTDDESGN